jgi:TonB family protein
MEIYAPPEPSSRVIWIAGLLAALLEIVVLTVFGYRGHWLAHPGKIGLDETKFVDAQIYEIPKEAKLIEKIAKIPPKVSHETTLSKEPAAGRTPAPSEKFAAENQTADGPPPQGSHGPMAIYAPPPEIPSYLRDQDLKATVVVDFFVSAQGAVTPRLVGSSGNEELDAIAMETAKKWQFRPAEKDHKAVDAKVRLRILFTVQ